MECIYLCRMNVTLIAAIGSSNELGKDNQLLWHLPSDLKRFKKTTTGHCLIMGRNTFDSIGKPLPNRTSIVITRDTGRSMEGVIFVNSLEQAFLEARHRNETECFVIGGAQIYEQALPYADRLDITHVYARFNADVYFPPIDDTVFAKVCSNPIEADEHSTLSYEFCTYERIEKKQKAIFLDRDGVLNREIDDYITSVELLEPDMKIVPFLKQKQEEGYLLIVITNQGAIEKKRLTHETLHAINKKLIEAFDAEGIRFTEIYYCPHHTTLSKCLCRKPHSLMVEKAVARFGIDIYKSIMIGDKDRDKDCSEGAGVMGIVIPDNQPQQIGM